MNCTTATRLLAMAEGAQHQPQRRRGLALAVTGEHQHQPLLPVALADPLLLHLLTAGHAAAIALLVGLGGQYTTGPELGGQLVQLSGLWRSRQIARSQAGGYRRSR
jgi:hypothetical protein